MQIGDWIVIPAAIVQKQMRIRERDRIWHARQRYTYPTKDKRQNHHAKDSKTAQRVNAPFIMWDGEGPRDAGYALFGNSAGYEICHPFLRTEECLELIMECESENPDAIHFGYGFNYDVSMILKDLPRRYMSALHSLGRTVWKDWEIEHIPHKWFKIKRGQVQTTIFDVRSFFAGSYLGALDDFDIGTYAQRERVREGKNSRAEFVWSEIREIREYWLTELELGPLLMDKLRQVFADAGYVPRSWHGPGALARMALRRHKVYDAMAKTPVEVQLAAQWAFAGGRFELFKAGHTQGKVYNADINSAYPYFATQLPNLARGRWRRSHSFEANTFGVWHIAYNGSPDSFSPQPLFRRMVNGMVVWPYRTEGWYWQPEAELVANNPNAKFIEGWVFDEDDPDDRPFLWLAEYYLRRKRLKANGSAAEYTFKLIINSVYGQLAQRAGWNRKTKVAPKSHQLEWAGYITSACRAAVYKVAVSCGEKIVSIDTDGVSSLAPIDGLQSGTRLGEWELSEYEDGIFWQSGIYSLKQGDEWVKAKTRGIPKGSYTAEELLDCLRRNEPLRLSKNVFITYGLADNGRWGEVNTWIKEPHVFEMGGNGKRIHFRRACKFECRPPLHRLGAPLWEYGPEGDCMSKRHWLPWLAPPDRVQGLMDDFAMFDANHLDNDQEWMRDYEYVE